MNPPDHPIHPGWHRLTERLRRSVLTRRQFLPIAGAAALLPSFTSGRGLKADRAGWHSNNKIKHVVILCQENRSFDHYFGAFADQLGQPGATARGFDPAKLAFRNSKGRRQHVAHVTEYCAEDPDHGWGGSHAKWNDGAMDGWVTAEGDSARAIQYFEPADHIYHVQLAQAFSIADHYFCSQIGPTLPNRLYLWSGTSGWDYLAPTTTSNSLPYNNPSLTAPPPVLTWPSMADVLDAAGLPWKCYSVADGSVPSAIGAFNPLIFFRSILTDPLKLARATADISEFLADLAAGTLPAVSWIVTEATVSEHPPAPPDMGQLLASRVVQTLMASSAWESTALFVTYDEGGGFFETVAPNILEHVPDGLPEAGQAVGPAFRVPLFIVSPYAKADTVYKKPMDHTSILQFVEHTFSTRAKPVHLPTIAPFRRNLASLAHAFDFGQSPISPSLPTPQELYAQAKNEILLLNLGGTVASCATTVPAWLPQLLGV
ncbi:MAG TPA: alkaline phosphatase family protein [Rhizomicrobium sp.]|nr:alkaline phosphatase family protein [Rhizomicrobium sp.]